MEPVSPKPPWLAALTGLARGREDRIDALVNRLTAVHGDAPALQELRAIIHGEIESARRLRTAAFVLVLALVALTAVGGFLHWNRTMEYEALNESVRAAYARANSPVVLYNTADGRIGVTVDAQDPSVSPDALRLIEEAGEDGGLGRYAQLGRRQKLVFSFDSTFDYSAGARYTLSPQGDDSVVVGEVTLRARHGYLEGDDRPLRPEGEPRAFEDLQTFGVRLVRYDVEQEAYLVDFCEREQRRAPFVCAGEAYAVRRSRAGRTPARLVVAHPDWKGVYVVSIGLGTTGEGGQVWTIQAQATKLNLSA